MLAIADAGWAAALVELVRANPTSTGALFLASVAISLGGVLLMPVLIARMRPDHFVRPVEETASWFGRHPVARIAGRIVKNVVGAVLVVAGVAMLVLPGQGIVTILVGTSLLEFPGKRRLELFIVRQRHVRQAIGWIRKRAHQPPLVLPPRTERRRRKRAST